MNIVKAFEKIFLKTKLIYLLIFLALLWPIRYAIYEHYMHYIYTKKINQNFMKNLNKAMDSGQKTVKIFDLAEVHDYVIKEVCFFYKNIGYRNTINEDSKYWDLIYILTKKASNEEDMSIHVYLDKTSFNLEPLNDKNNIMYRYKNQNTILSINEQNNKITFFLSKGD